MTHPGKPASANSVIIWDGSKYVAAPFGGSTGSVAVQVNGSTVSTRSILNFLSGASIADNSGAGSADITLAAGDVVIKAIITGNITRSGIPSSSSADSVSLNSGDLVLLAGQSTASQNGIYAVAAGDWSTARAKLLTGNSAAGARVYADQGFSWGKSTWTCTSDSGSDVVGTNSLTWRWDGKKQTDIPYDANDVFEYWTTESTIANTITNSIPGGTSYPLTAQYVGSAYDWTGHDSQFSLPGPFNGTSNFMFDGGLGWIGSNNVLAAPSAFTLSMCVRALYSGNTASSSNMFTYSGRTRVSGNATGYDTTNLAIAMANQGNQTSAWKELWADIKRSGQASFDEIKAQNASPANSTNPMVLTNGLWHLVTLVYDGTKLYLYSNGMLANAISASGTVDGATTGYWFVGAPSNSGGSIYSVLMQWCRCRLSNVARSSAWVQERARRLRQWI